MVNIAPSSVVLALAAIACCIFTLRSERGTRARQGGLILTAVFAALAVIMSAPTTPEGDLQSLPTLREPVEVNRVAALPVPAKEQGYVSSDSCKECHQEQYSTWYQTYHRTMTQAASPESVIPDWDNVTLTSRGRTYYLERREDEFWVDMIDPAVEMRAFVNRVDVSKLSNLPRKKMQIVMTTGSHHHQTYWTQSPSGTFVQFPWVYHIKQDRWVFRIDSFLAPPHDTLLFNIWNTSCIACHTTGAQPHVTAQTMHSEGELGIACEACHGPGSFHVHERQLAANGVTQVTEPAVDFDVVNPKRLSPEESAKACGQCHLVSERKDEAEWMVAGDPFRVGRGDFLANRTLTTIADDTGETRETVGGARQHTRFWPDGAVRAGGREYNGLIDSPCYLNGHGTTKMTCTSCHSMHGADPNKLVAPGMETNLACTQCHHEPRFNDQLQEHTHHLAGSSGSLCYNCHMPKTSYALFHAARSHRIDSPVATITTEGMRPNACNLCHLDQTMKWTASHLSNWFGASVPSLAEEESRIPASVLWAMRGDASQRAITAWHFGWEPAREASGDHWSTRYLSELLTDPYGAVRYLAYESLITLPSFEDFKLDLYGGEDEREQARAAALRRWRESMELHEVENGARLLLGKQFDPEVKSLKADRDDRPITVLE